MSLLRRENPK